MKTFIQTTLIIILLSGCANKSAENKPKEINLSDYKSEKVHFLDKELLIPKNYEQISVSDYQEKLLSPEGNDTFDDITKSSIEILQLTSADIAIFADKDNFRNCFWIQLSDYVDFDKNIATQYIGIIESGLMQDRFNLGMVYEKIESKFMQTSTSKIIKVKLLQKYRGAEKYFTQYIVTNARKTFAITVINNENVDFEEMIIRI